MFRFISPTSHIMQKKKKHLPQQNDDALATTQVPTERLPKASSFKLNLTMSLHCARHGGEVVTKRDTHTTLYLLLPLK